NRNLQKGGMMLPSEMMVPPVIRRLVGWPILQWRMRAWHAFMNATKNPEAMQAKKLAEILRATAGSRFSSAHHLSPQMSVSAFRAGIAVAGYDRMEPWLTRVLHGEKQALFSQDTELLMFAMTSGTTAACKYIP